MTKEYIVIAFTENQTGVLNRITTLYLRRKINIESLKVSESSIRKGVSMFVISAFTSEATIKKLVSQLRNIIDVIEVEYYDNENLISQEIALYKITPPEGLQEIHKLYSVIGQYNARIIEVTPKFMVIERTGTREDIERMRNEFNDRGILAEFTRSGSVVLHRENIEQSLEHKLSKFID